MKRQGMSMEGGFAAGTACGRALRAPLRGADAPHGVPGVSLRSPGATFAPPPATEDHPFGVKSRRGAARGLMGVALASLVMLVACAGSPSASPTAVKGSGAAPGAVGVTTVGTLPANVV